METLVKSNDSAQNHWAVNVWGGQKLATEHSYQKTFENLAKHNDYGGGQKLATEHNYQKPLKTLQNITILGVGKN